MNVPTEAGTPSTHLTIGPAIGRLEQLVQNVLHRHLHAGKDRRIALGVFAALGLAQLHHQVQEILGLLGLEGDDEVLVVQAEAVGRVELDAGVLVADA